MAEQIVTANRLNDGIVVYYGGNALWVADINEAACCASGKDAGEALLAESRTGAYQTIVVDPYLMDVVRDATGKLEPTKYREKIRTLGPSVRLDLGKQVWGPKGHAA
jgi:hypothetical protein